MTELGAKAVMLPTNVDGAYLGDRSVLAIVGNDPRTRHLRPSSIRKVMRDPWYQKFALWNSIGQQIEEAKAMASIIYEGVLDAIPG